MKKLTKDTYGVLLLFTFLTTVALAALIGYTARTFPAIALLSILVFPQGAIIALLYDGVKNAEK